MSDRSKMRQQLKDVAFMVMDSVRKFLAELEAYGEDIKADSKSTKEVKAQEVKEQ